jgi:hypothetical protein
MKIAATGGRRSGSPKTKFPNCPGSQSLQRQNFCKDIGLFRQILILKVIAGQACAMPARPAGCGFDFLEPT